MRIEYYQFRNEEEMVKKEMEEKRKREQLRDMLRKAEIEQLEMKKRQKEEEDYL